MINTRTFATCAVGLVLLTHGVNGQAVSQYRNFELGVNVAAVSALTGQATSDAKTIHQRPALLQDLEWRPSHWRASDTLPSTDPVQQIGFSFYNDRLFRIVVDYDRDRTEGMTDADMVEAISAVYGVSAARAAGPARVASRVETESKIVGFDIAASDVFRQAVPDLAWLEAGTVQLKGKAKRMPVHILVGDTHVAITPDFVALRDAHLDWLAGGGDLAQCISLAAKVDPRLARFYELIPGRADDFVSPA